MPQTVVTAYCSNELLPDGLRRYHTKQDVGNETTGISFQGIVPQGGGLKPSMVNYKLKLKVNEVIMAEGTNDDEIQLDIRRHLVKEVLRSAFPEQFAQIFGGKDDKDVLPMPIGKLAEIPHPPIKELKDLPFDNYTEEGTEHVIEQIYFHNFHLSESDFYDKVFMLFTDQHTLENIRIMKFLHDEDEDYGHAAKKWLLPFPSLMHTRMHLLEMLLRGHFGGDPRKGGSLYNHLQFLEIPNVSEQSSEFWGLEELATQSYRARILALTQEKLKQTIPELEQTLSKYTPDEFIALVSSIVDDMSNRANWNTFDQQFHNDQEVQAHYLFLRHSEVYFVFKHAIEAGDLGLLKRAISMACLQFHGSGQANYAYQILHMIRYVIANTIPKEIQDILLVNAITHARIFEQTATGGQPTEYNLQIQKVRELALKMYTSGSPHITPGRMVIYPAKNLQHEGRVILSNERLLRFNRKEVDKVPDDEYPEEDTLEGHFNVYIDTKLHFKGSALGP